MAVEITRAYAELAQSKMAHDLKTFLLFFCSIQGKIALWANLSKFLFNLARLCHFGSKENSIICFFTKFLVNATWVTIILFYDVYFADRMNQ